MILEVANSVRGNALGNNSHPPTADGIRKPAPQSGARESGAFGVKQTVTAYGLPSA